MFLAVKNMLKVHKISETVQYLIFVVVVMVFFLGLVAVERRGSDFKITIVFCVLNNLLLVVVILCRQI